MSKILTIDGHTFRPTVQCGPSKEVTDQCVRHAFSDGTCVLHGCVDCPARLYEVPVIEIVDAPATGFLEGWLIALIIVTAVLSGVASHIGMSREASAYQSDRRI